MRKTHFIRNLIWGLKAACVSNNGFVLSALILVFFATQLA